MDLQSTKATKQPTPKAKKKKQRKIGGATGEGDGVICEIPLL